MTQTVQHFIDNTFTAGSSTRTGDIYNPALGEKTGDVVMGTAADVQAAVDAAKRA